MEVDILSPQMRIRSVPGSNKRARSPGSPSPLERASKRAFISQFSCSVGVSQEGGGGSVRRWSPCGDEWVNQTQGMTIHSPALSEGDRLSIRSGEGEDEESRGDVQMTGLEDNTSPRNASHEETPTPRPDHTSASSHTEDSSMTSPTCSQQQHDSHTHSNPNSHHHSLEPGPVHLASANEALDSLHALLETPRPHRTRNNYPNSDSSNNAVHPPKITLHPATPSTPSDGPRLAYALSLSQPSTPPPLVNDNAGDTPSSPMSVVGESNSPHSSQTPTQSWRINCSTPGQRRKAFVSMGPRTDCEKCRLKVPGHWMHFD